jgi:hypothetical protein
MRALEAEITPVSEVISCLHFIWKWRQQHIAICFQCGPFFSFTIYVRLTTFEAPHTRTH